MLHSIWHYRLRTEKDDIRYLLNQDLTNQVVLDIGANKGIYTYWMSKCVGPTGRVIAFEPQPELEIHLLHFKKAFKLKNLYIVNKALSDTNGKSKIYRSEIGSGGASLFQKESDWESVEIDVTMLDEFFSDRRKTISFIKCDVEGLEYNVFKGGKDLLKCDKPALLFECHHAEAERGELFNYLKSLGYDGFFLYKKQMIDCKRFAEFPYRKKGESHRNYLFLARS